MDPSHPNSTHELAERMARLSREMAAPRALEHVLTDVTAAAVQLIPATDIAGVLLVKRGGDFESLADTDSLVAELDRLQHEFGEGPCADAALKQTVVRTDDLRKEPRWPRYAPAAVQHGVLSSLSFKLYTADRTAGALNLFSFQAGAWDTEAETIGSVFAAHAAAAIMAGRHGEQMESALSSRDRIGQAKGIIMERYGVDDVRAFEMLRALSQEGQTKLVDIAERVIETRSDR
ncbi:GAF and ANTAR domain-containing protein [Mycobacterium paraense]|uniref:GAF and ANTAR domain-containing protein n=1 Tax=Mycobacterium paraense TaxID=767916 RepID=UPI000A163985|nr:GAF and ANTAR domain-containing protein [Mycobacterium paraense]MCV7445514.1 GAF and ANTAR domain-containing protein [Mycobacterium paraense]ORW46545.1 histidine kinase [Mycobacterium paraense]